jgi:ketosteroid isomerase-like protein
VTSGADHVAVAHAYLAALGGGDPSAVAALVSDDFVNEHIAELGSGCIGRRDYARRLPGFFEMFPNRRYTVEETAVGAAVDSEHGPAAIEVIVRYRFGADVGDVRIDIPGVMWITLRDGTIVRRLDSWDSLTFHRQTGTPVDG